MYTVDNSSQLKIPLVTSVLTINILLRTSNCSIYLIHPNYKQILHLVLSHSMVSIIHMQYNQQHVLKLFIYCSINHKTVIILKLIINFYHLKFYFSAILNVTLCASILRIYIYCLCISKKENIMDKSLFFVISNLVIFLTDCTQS